MTLQKMYEVTQIRLYMRKHWSHPYEGIKVYVGTSENDEFNLCGETVGNVLVYHLTCTPALYGNMIKIRSNPSFYAISLTKFCSKSNIVENGHYHFPFLKDSLFLIYGKV